MTATKRKPKPITANPLFPLVTALWFATLLGLGSFATAPMLLEGPVVSLGIPAFIPAAAPPLGFTTRIIFAFAMMGLGAVIGYSLGRFLGREKVATPVRARGFGKNTAPTASSTACRPINAAEDLGAPLDAPVTEEISTRRRAVARMDEQLVLETPEFEHEPVATSGGAPFASPTEKQVFQPSASADTMLHVPKVADPLDLDLLMEGVQVIDPAPLNSPQPLFAAPQQTLPQSAAFTQADPVAFESEAETDLNSLGIADEPVKPVAFEDLATTHPASGPFMPQQFAPAPSAPVPPVPTPSALFTSPVAAPAPFLQARAVDATPIDRAALDDLGLVQLVERLALAISRRSAPSEPVQAKAPEMPSSAPVAAPAMARFEKASDIVEQAAIPVLPTFEAPGVDSVTPAAAFAPVQPERVVQLRPSSMQPLQSFPDAQEASEAEEAEAEQDNGLERFLRMSPLLSRKPEHVAEAFGINPEFAPEPEVAEDCYPSLLDMAPAAVRREPLRIDDSAHDADAIIEPRVIFPGQETPWPADVARSAVMPMPSSPVAPSQAAASPSRPFERPSVVPVPGSPLASPGRAAPSAQVAEARQIDPGVQPAAMPDAEEADRALRAALATLQRMTARG